MFSHLIFPNYNAWLSDCLRVCLLVCVHIWGGKGINNEIFILGFTSSLPT